jgi:hypothetical protein
MIGKVVRPKCDDGKQAEQGRSGAKDCLIELLALGFDELRLHALQKHLN